MEKHKKYIEKDNLKDATHIEVSIYYDKGGMSYFSGKTSQRGYYMSVVPVRKAGGMISFTLFTGYKQLLMETKQKL